MYEYLLIKLFVVEYVLVYKKKILYLIFLLKFVFIIFKKGCIFSIKWFVVLKLDNFFFCYIVYCICIKIKYRNDGI